MLFKEKETKIELNLEEITSYAILKEKILDFFKESDTNIIYHIMAINSSNPYTLLEEENFSQILNEKIEGEDLKLFLNKINPDEINNDMNTIEQNRKVEYALNVNDDEDFVIENDEDDNKRENEQEEKKEINDNDGDIDKQLKINENVDVNDNEEKKNEDDKDLLSQTDEIMKKIDQLIGGNDIQFTNNLENININKKEENKIIEEIEENKIEEENNSNIINNNINIEDIKKKENVKKAPLPFSKKNPVLNIVINNNIKNDNEDEDENLDFFDENSLISKYIYPNTFKSIKCIICQSQLSWVKYICCVCENCVMCANCEKTHYHPCFKLKSDFLSNISDIYKFISTFYSFKPSKNFFTKFFTKEYEIKISPICDKKICVRPKKNFLFPINITNLTTNTINSSQFEIISKNNKIIKILNLNKNFTLGPNGNHTIKLKCKTKNCKGKENVEFLVFSDNLTFKNQETIKFDVDFEINDDWEEEQINLFFENNEFAILYNKQHKQLAQEVLKTSGNKHIDKVSIKKLFDILVTNGWNKSIALNNINNLKK